MNKIGCCLPGKAVFDGKTLYSKKYSDVVILNNYALEVGFDYIEMPLGDVMHFSNQEITKAKNELRIRSTNGFLPNRLYMFYLSNIIYAKKAFAKLEKIGVETVVFGSGRNRKIKYEFLRNIQTKMLKFYLKYLGKLGKKHNITVVIEPLNHAEDNIITSVGDAVNYANEINQPNLKALADIFHMAREGESFDEIKKHLDNIKHIHIAGLIDRLAPGLNTSDDTVKRFFEVIKTTDYKDKISIEARINDYKADLKTTIEYIKALQ